MPHRSADSMILHINGLMNLIDEAVSCPVIGAVDSVLLSSEVLDMSSSITLSHLRRTACQHAIQFHHLPLRTDLLLHMTRGALTVAALRQRSMHESTIALGSVCAILTRERPAGSKSQ